MDAVTSGRVKITPERYAKGYLDWLSEKRDWPIGRQLWWGHQIPVWHWTIPFDQLNPQLQQMIRDNANAVQEEIDYAARRQSEIDFANQLDNVNPIFDLDGQRINIAQELEEN